MYVSKIVRDYIEATVKEKIKMPATEWDELFKHYSAEKEKIEEEIQNFAKDKINKLQESFPMLKISNMIEDRSCVYLDEMESKEYKKFIEERNKICIKRKKIINNIIVTLELGGNKSDLDRMLNEIRE